MYAQSFVSFTWRWLNKSTKSWYNRCLTSTVSDAPIDTRNDNRISFKSEKWISNREKKIIHKHSKLSIVNNNNTNNSNNIANNNSLWLILYIYWLGFRTTGVFTRERINCLKPEVEWKWSVRGSNKTAVVREASLYLFCYAPSFFLNCLITFSNKNSLHSRSSS